MKVLILKGLPASGKSTFAKKLVSGDIHDMGRNWKRVNKDDLRAMLDNSFWSKENENFVIRLRNHIVTQAILDGFNVVIDDTNLNPKHEQDVRFMCNEIEKQTKVHTPVETLYFDTPYEVCLKRNRERTKLLKKAKLPALVKDFVITNMYEQYVKDKDITADRVQKYKPEPETKKVVYVPPTDAPHAIIVDIDGTLAHMTGRSAYDYRAAINDSLDEVVSHVVKSYIDNHAYKVIICSGREDDCKDVTEEWLAKHGIHYDMLLMRKAGDHRPDNIVKRELFDANIRDDFNIRFVLDDRDQVVQMWRNELGLKVLQVAEGDF